MKRSVYFMKAGRENRHSCNETDKKKQQKKFFALHEKIMKAFKQAVKVANFIRRGAKKVFIFLKSRTIYRWLGF